MNNELGVICGTSDGAVTRGKEVICSQCGKGKLWLSDSSVEAALGIDPSFKESDIKIFCIECASKNSDLEIAALAENQLEEINNLLDKEEETDKEEE